MNDRTKKSRTDGGRGQRKSGSRGGRKGGKKSRGRGNRGEAPPSRSGNFTLADFLDFPS